MLGPMFSIRSSSERWETCKLWVRDVFLQEERVPCWVVTEKNTKRMPCRHVAGKIFVNLVPGPATVCEVDIAGLLGVGGLDLNLWAYLSLELMHAIDEEHTVFVTIISFFFFPHKKMNTFGLQLVKCYFLNTLCISIYELLNWVLSVW